MPRGKAKLIGHVDQVGNLGNGVTGAAAFQAVFDDLLNRQFEGKGHGHGRQQPARHGGVHEQDSQGQYAVYRPVTQKGQPAHEPVQSPLAPKAEEPQAKGRVPEFQVKQHRSYHRLLERKVHPIHDL